MSDSQTQQVVFQPYEWICGDHNKSFQIRIWGHQMDSSVCLVVVKGFEPFVRLIMPSTIDGKNFVWSTTNLKLFKAWMNEQDKLKYCMPTRITANAMKTMYYYKEKNNAVVLTCYFNEERKMRNFTYFFNSDLTNLEKFLVKYLDVVVQPTVCEAGISQIHKFITDKKLTYGGWTTAKCIKPSDGMRMSKQHVHEYHCWVDSLSLVEGEQLKMCQSVKVNIKMMSFDIETYSKNHKKFPNAKNVSDVITMISMVIANYYDIDYKSDEKYKKIALVLGYAPEIEGCEIIICQSEVEMIMKFFEIIDREDPTFLLGYNIYRFDIPYILDRLDILYNLPEPWQHTNCSKMLVSKIDIKEEQWSSGATGKMSVIDFQCEGRVMFDMLAITRREHPGLRTFKLDDVAHDFLGKSKHDVSAIQMFETYYRMMELRPLLDADRQTLTEDEMKTVDAFLVEQARIIKYCIQDSALPAELMKKMGQGVALIESSTIFKVSPKQIYTKGQQIRIENQIYSQCYFENIVMDKRSQKIDRYKGAFVHEPELGLHYNVGTLDFNSLYPSIIIKYNICHTTLYQGGHLTPDQYHTFPVEEYDKKGNIVNVHHFSFVKKEVHHGILPRLCAYLIGKRKEVRKEKAKQNDPIICQVMESQQLALKILANSIYGSLGVSEGGRCPLFEGAMTICYQGRKLNEVATNYVHDNNYGKVVYGDTDSIMFKLAGNPDIRQAVDIFKKIEHELNDLFGGVLTMELEKIMARVIFQSKKFYTALSCVVIDRKNIESIVKIETNVPCMLGDVYRIEQKNGKVIHLALQHPDNFDDYPIICGISVSNQGLISDGDGLIKKGSLLVRRDSCNWVKVIYKELLFAMIQGMPIQHIFDRYFEEVFKLLQRNCKYDESLEDPWTLTNSYASLCIMKTIGTYSVKSNHPLKTFKEIRHQLQKPIQTGEKIEYIVVQDDSDETSQGKKYRLIQEYPYNPEPIDFVFYIRLLSNALTKLIMVSYPEYIQEVETKHLKIYGQKRMKTVKKYNAKKFRVERCVQYQINTSPGEEMFESFIKLCEAKAVYHKELLFWTEKKEMTRVIKEEGIIKLESRYINRWDIIHGK